MNAGITSQYGFLYQRLIFVYKVLKNISPSCLFVFEGKDDIDVLPAEQISSIIPTLIVRNENSRYHGLLTMVSAFLCNRLLLDNIAVL